MDAHVVRVVESGGVRKIVVLCPYCCMLHSHGGGLVSEPLENYLTSRAAHCSSTLGYFVKNGLIGGEVENE